MKVLVVISVIFICAAAGAVHAEMTTTCHTIGLLAYETGIRRNRQVPERQQLDRVDQAVATRPEFHDDGFITMVKSIIVMAYDVPELTPLEIEQGALDLCNDKYDGHATMSPGNTLEIHGGE